PIPTEIPTDTPIPEVPTPTPTTTQALSYDLLIARRGGESLFIVNETADAFPLAPLRLGDEAGAISGTEWGLELLDSEACVTAWEGEGNPKPPNVNCTQVGPPLTRVGKDRFWREAFNIYYQEQLIDVCDNNRCSITISR
ncbi:MAG TPA: hypothetical protein VEC96_02035, partial [Anaerolineae bacterium]|nr:hypothetical protein [Anaerolineae bacterium]